MREVVAEVAAWRAAGERVALATVVGVTGSAPRPVGATLAATGGSRMAGSVSNGCVEAAVYEECMAALDANTARVVHYGISDELAFTVGLSCGGAIDVLVEPLGPLQERALAAVREDRAAVLARVTAPADRAGTIGLVTEDGTAVEWGGRLAAIAGDAQAALRDGRSRTVALGDETVFLEALPSSPTLFIIGATHAAVALARLAKVVGYRVVVADPRVALASRERFPDADELVHAWPEAAFARVRITDRTAVVLLSHDPKFDRPGLLAALRSAAGYIGAIGSRRTNEERLAWLRAQGVAEYAIERLRAPIGLDIGAATAEEIALSILAEILAATRHRDGTSLSARSLVAVG